MDLVFQNPPKLTKFKVVGFLSSSEFQICRHLVEKLHICYPNEYAEPEIRAMLNLDWDEYLTKMKRRHGKAYYLLDSSVAVYHDGKLMGDDKALLAHIKNKYNLETTIDLEKLANEEIFKFFTKIMDKNQRNFIYLTIAISDHVVGSMLFMLYNDLVPITCDNFQDRCLSTSLHYSYKNTKIHRIVKPSWIQCGYNHLQEIQMPCENYAIPHDRRGVLSMCNQKRHRKNSTQFFITLGPASWMDYNYVAFGQLVQGAEILNLIEKVPTIYENPTRKIEICNCGQLSFCPEGDEDYKKAMNPSYEELFEEAGKDDVDSVLSEIGFRAGKYCLRTDLRSYLPFTRYSRMFDIYMQRLDDQVLEGNFQDLKNEYERLMKIHPMSDIL